MRDAPKILLVDHDLSALHALKALLKSHYQVITTQDCFEALKILRREKINVIIADERMPIISGTEILRHARYIMPFATRVLLTDSDRTLIDPTNRSEIFSCIQRPWNYASLYETIIRAVEQSKRVENTSVIPAVKRIPVLIDQVVEPVVSSLKPERLICLVLDHEGYIYQMVKGILEPSHEVFWGQSVTEALSILSCQSVAVFVTELSQGDQEIRGLFNTVKQSHADMLTLVLSDLRDVSLLSELTVRRQVFRSLPKPARRGILEKNLASAIAYYQTTHVLSAQAIPFSAPKMADSQPISSSQSLSKAGKLLLNTGISRGMNIARI